MALVTFVAPVFFTAGVEAAAQAREASRDVAVLAATTTTLAPRSTAAHIAEIQRRLTAVTGVTQPEAPAVKALARSLMTVRGVKEDAAAITRLAAALAEVLAGGALAEYEMERVAQGLFAASSSTALPDADAELLALDLATLLQEAGADTDAIATVLTALQRICPAAKLPSSGIPPRTAPRRLSVLSRQ